MPQDPLRASIDAIRARVQAELDAQLAAIVDQHATALAEAQRTADIQAEQRWTAKVEAVRAEWTARLESEVTAARGEAERRAIAEGTRARMEAEQAAAESAARMREELEHALAAERQRAQVELQSERERAEREIERLRGELQAESEARGQAQSSAVVEARASERQTQLAGLDRLLGAVRAISAASSLSETLAALVQRAAAEAPRAALFIVDGDHLQGFKDEGFVGMPPSSLTIPANDTSVLGEAVRRGAVIATAADGQGTVAPRFAALSTDRAGIAVPLVVGDRTVAVLYADDGGNAPAEVPGSWPESVQILARHASACLAHLTALRAAQAVSMHAARGRSTAAKDASGEQLGDATPDDENGARRYARLLVSEIKLYNESAVQLGRQKRDLLSRLRPEIDRARRLYEERVPRAVAAREMYFHQELVQTLADGDSALLGG